MTKARANLVNAKRRPAITLALVGLQVAACGPTGHDATPGDDRDVTTMDAPSSFPDAAAPSDAPSSDRSADVPRANSALRPRGPAAVFVHLFEWKWTDIAAECENYLGPAGFFAVQVSPPSEHLVLPAHPWWQRYQTVGYSLAKSRSGTADEFADMVRRCGAVGVSIYVDAVINHMTGQASGTGSNGTHFTKYEYPGLYTAADFHMPPCTIADSDYQNAPDRVRTCELLGLADLDTSSDHVRDQIAGYLSSLVELGVRGFRIDAAKHIAPDDLDAILGKVSANVAPLPPPYYFFEVIDYGGEAIHASDYLPVGQGTTEAVDMIEFKFGGVGDAFLNAQGKTLADLRSLGEASWNLLPSNRAVVFIDNHDEERASSLFYQDAPYYDLAVAFMLAWPYGYPSILSGFAFDRTTQAGRDSGPPSDTMGNTRSVYPAGSNSPDCATDSVAVDAGWLCEHRRPYVARMISFRKATASTEVTNFWDDGSNQIAFGRGDKGFVVINRSANALDRVFQTSLQAGSYCDVFQGAQSPTGGCSGAVITVDATGMAHIDVAPFAAVAIHVGAPAAP